MSTVVEVIAQVIGEDALTVPEVMRGLRATGSERVSRRAVEAALADDARFLDDGGGLKARWSVDPDAITAPDPDAHDTPVIAVARPLEGLSLRDWQIEAFAAWASAGSRGVVEAVTGTGKTRLAIAATRATLANGGRVLVIVPTLELQQQWVRELRELVPQARLGRLGGGDADDLHDNHVVIATPHSAAKVPIDPPGLGLLIADEAHRYGAPTWGAALRETFQMRLALTATYERSDEGVDDVLAPYFGDVVYDYGYDRAVPDGVVAPFRIAFVGTALDEHEREQYESFDRQAKRLHGELTGTWGLSRDPRKMFIELARLAALPPGGGRDRARSAAALSYLASVRGRRDVAATCAGKLDVVRRIAPAMRAHADRSLVFCDTIEQGEQAARLLSSLGVTAETVHGDLPRDQRRIRLAQFRKGNLDALVAPRVLDEGVDVPEADVAIVLSAFRSRRQMIQRLGRVLRLKPDGRDARLVVAFAQDTREDPGRGAHDDFLAEVTGVARAVNRYPDPVGTAAAHEAARDLEVFLCPIVPA